MSLLQAFLHIELPPSFSEGSAITLPSTQGLFAAIASTEHPFLLVTASSRRADELTEELTSYLGMDSIAIFPPWETLPHERLSPKSDTVAQRFKTLHQLKSQKPPRIVVTSIRGLIQPIIATILDAQLPIIEINKTLSMSALIESLSFLGYTRTDLVERRGDFAVRGGIIDLFPPDLEHPVRIDFFGDEIEELAYFTVSDQRTFEPVVGELTVFPCRELLLTTEVRERAKYLAAEFPSLTEICNKIAEGISVDGMESLIGALNTKLNSLIDFLPANYRIVVIDEPRIISRAMDLIATNKEFLDASWSNAANGGSSPIDIFGGIRSGGYFELEDLKGAASSAGLEWRSLNPYASDLSDEKLDFEPLPIYRNDLDLLERDLKNWLTEGFWWSSQQPDPASSNVLTRYLSKQICLLASRNRSTRNSLEMSFI